MIIEAVIVTCNRIDLLPRALNSVQKQYRQTDDVWVISNSNPELFEKEQKICKAFNFKWMKNFRTLTYTGALNCAVQEIVKKRAIDDSVYFASLDDDDEWLPDYLQELEKANDGKYDLLIGCLKRTNISENHVLKLPGQLSYKNFLVGNPGLCGSNTFIRLDMLLKAGAFDEAMVATADRDFFVRVFQQKPNYKIINKHLVNQHTDNDRPRQTISGDRKKESLKYFYYKYRFLMDQEDENKFFSRAIQLFSVNKNDFLFKDEETPIFKEQKITFGNKGNCQLTIGFIAGNEFLLNRIINEINNRQVPADLVLIINNTKKEISNDILSILNNNKIHLRIINAKEWKANLKKERYGSAFKGATKINSIPLGRSILHYHLYQETLNYEQPVIWIIDDDISFSSVVLKNGNVGDTNLFGVLSQLREEIDAVVGGVSNDPPLPFLSSIRSQLIDFIYSHWAGNTINQDLLNIRNKPDYYYDLSDMGSDHLEMPIYHKEANEFKLDEIFSGMSVSRKVFQKEHKVKEQIITQRGPNTIVFNRDLLHYYPVVNIKVKNKNARRGDLFWVLLNQVISNRKIVEHTFSVQQQRHVIPFMLARELEKSAYDIIGYAFNKGFLKAIRKIKKESNPNRPKDVFLKLNETECLNCFFETFLFYLNRRTSKFLMNYYRIIGLVKLLAKDFEKSKKIYDQLSEMTELDAFHELIFDVKKITVFKEFFNGLTDVICSYSNSIIEVIMNEEKN